MSTKERLAHQRELYNIYAGLLYANRNFHEGLQIAPEYNFDCPEYAILKEKYSLEEIAGRGSDFQRALRLLHHFAPKMVHKSDYDNHVECNSLALLDYCYEKPENGINCLNKSKILAECCMAVGIKARRVGIYPCSPYDMDNHVVTEIYDRKLEKWIMLDPTSNGYFIDAEYTPLSCMEIRGLIAEMNPCTVIYPRQSAKNFDALFEKNLQDNAYYAKNMFYFSMDMKSAFGYDGQRMWFVPEYYNLRSVEIRNALYRADMIEKFGLDTNLREYYLEIARELETKELVFGHADVWKW